MKDVKKLLRGQAKQILPDKDIPDKIKRELGFSGQAEDAAYAHGGTVSVSRRNRILAIAAAALAVVLCLCIVLPIALNRSPAGPGIIDSGTIGSVDSADEFYAYGAASVGSLLAASNAASTAAPSVSAGIRLRSLASVPLQLTEGEQQIAETVSGYLSLVEGLLSDEAIQYTAVQLEEDLYGYSCRMTVTVRDMLGGSIEYTMYYDKVLTGSETDGDETEHEYSIDGILLVGNEQYPVKGEKETETETDETELSLCFTAFRPNDRDRKIPYLRMEQETEQETEGDTEKSFVYTLFDEVGDKIETTAVEYEHDTEDGELELKIIVERGSRKDELRFRRKDGQNNVLDAEATIDGEQYTFSVTVQEGNYRYEFKDGNHYDGDRGQHGDDDDD